MMRPQPTRPLVDRIATRATRWLGSPLSLVVHTLLFIACFALVLLGVDFEQVLLMLTTAVSLEAIYLALFIQMSVNRTVESLEVVEEELDEIQEDVQEIHEDVAEIEKDIDEIQEDVQEIHDDVAEIEKDIDEIEKDEDAWRARDMQDAESLKAIEKRLSDVLADLERLRR
jgi:low affinity Fe/Cu permease